MEPQLIIYGIALVIFSKLGEENSSCTHLWHRHGNFSKKTKEREARNPCSSLFKATTVVDKEDKRGGKPFKHTSAVQEMEDFIRGLDLHDVGFMGPKFTWTNNKDALSKIFVRVDKGGRELLVDMSFALEASQALAERRFSFQIKCWEAYARLYKRVSAQWWFAPGHGDWCTCLEKYKLCQDGMFHKEDQFHQLLSTFIHVIDMSENEKAEYWNVASAVFVGKQVVPDQTFK